MSMLFRAAQACDLDAVYSLAKSSGIGLTTLPKNKKLLEKRLKRAIDAFSTSRKAPDNEYYLFVLEDTEKKQVVGTAGLESITGKDAPFYSYRRVQETKSHSPFGVNVVHDYLSLTYENQGKSEVCTLYLDPKYRHSGNGLLLSLARFLFVYHFPERFANTIIAELRGVCDENGSPFWNAVGQHFFQMPFHSADERTISTDKQFIADLIPKHPIYVNLLPEHAKKVIGVPNSASQPAMKILMQQGFYLNDTVDIFDAGPTLEAKLNDILTIKQAQTLNVIIVPHHTSRTQHSLISNTTLDFKATLTSLICDLDNKKCIITEQVANQLSLKEGDLASISRI